MNNIKDKLKKFIKDKHINLSENDIDKMINYNTNTYA